MRDVGGNGTRRRGPGRDRRGRGRRGPLAWPPVPAMSTRRESFDDLVLDTAGRFEGVLGRHWERVEFAVEDVPPTDPEPWEGGVALAKLFPADGPLPARIIVYRRPVEGLAARGVDLPELLHEVLVEQVALLLGVEPEDVDPPHG